MKAKIQHEIQEYCSLLRLNAIGEHFDVCEKNLILSYPDAIPVSYGQE